MSAAKKKNEAPTAPKPRYVLRGVSGTPEWHTTLATSNAPNYEAALADFRSQGFMGDFEISSTTGLGVAQYKTKTIEDWMAREKEAAALRIRLAPLTAWREAAHETSQVRACLRDAPDSAEVVAALERYLAHCNEQGRKVAAELGVEW